MRALGRIALAINVFWIVAWSWQGAPLVYFVPLPIFGVFSGIKAEVHYRRADRYRALLDGRR